MVVHLSVVQKGTEGGCGTCGDTNGSIAGLEDDSNLPDCCRSPSPAMVVKDENSSENSNHSVCRDGRSSGSTEAAENAFAALEDSERVDSLLAAQSTTESPRNTFVVVRAHTGAVAAEADQRAGSGTASNSQQPAPLWKHRSATGSAPQDAGLHSIPMNAAAPLTWRRHLRSFSDPSLCLAVTSSDVAGAVAIPISERATAAVHSTPAASAPLHLDDPVTLPGDDASPLRDPTSSGDSPGASVISLAPSGEITRSASPASMLSFSAATPILACAAAAATLTVPPHSLAALPMSSVPDASPSLLPAVPPPSSSSPTLVSAPRAYPRRLEAPSPPPTPRCQRPQVSLSARMTTPEPVVQRGDGLREDLGEDLLPCHGRLRVPLGKQRSSAGCFSASGRLSSALCSTLFSACGSGTGHLSTSGSPSTAGLPEQPSNPSLLSGAGPPSKLRLLEARVLTAGTSSAQLHSRPPVPLPPIPCTGAAASSASSLSLLSPPSAMLGSFSSDSSHNNRSGGDPGASGFPSPVAFRSPFASVLTPQAHYQHHPATVSPYPCFSCHPTSLPPTTPPSQRLQPPAQLQIPLDRSPRCTSAASSPSLSSSFFSAFLPPTVAVSAAAAGQGAPAVSSLLPLRHGGVAVVSAVSAASAHNAAVMQYRLHANSPLEPISPATFPYSASPSSATIPSSSRSLDDGTGQARRSLLALKSSTSRLTSPSWPLPGEAASGLPSSLTTSATTVAKKKDRGDALRPSAPLQESVQGTVPLTLANEAGAVETEARKSISGVVGSDAVESRGNSQSQRQQQHQSQKCGDNMRRFSLRRVLAQPAVQSKAWRVLEDSGGGSCSVQGFEDSFTDIRGVGGKQSASIASPADSATAPQSPQQSYEREVSREAVEVLIAGGTGRQVDDNEANSHQRDRKVDDAGKDASTGDGSCLEDEVFASKGEHGARFTMCMCRRSRNSVAAQDTAATPAPAAHPLRPMSLHNRNSSSDSQSAHTTEAQEEVAAEERSFSISSILTSAATRAVGVAPSINSSSGLHATASSGATATAWSTATTVTLENRFRLSSFAALSHGKTNAAPEPAATAAAAGAGAEASRPPPPPPLMPPSSVSPSLFAAPGWGVRPSGTPAPLAERLSVSSMSCTPSLSPTCRKACGRVADSDSQSTCGATQALTTNSTAFLCSQMGVSSRSNSSLGGRRRRSPTRGSCRSRCTSSVTIIGVDRDESLTLPVRGVTSRAPGPAAAGAELWSVAAASTPAPHLQGTPISSAAVSPLTELLLTSPSDRAGSSVLYREGSSCNGDIPTPDMAAAAAAAVLRLHRQRPHFTPLSSTAPVSAPERCVAVQSPEGDAATAGNASASTGAATTAVPALPAMSTKQPKETSALSPQESSKGSSRLLYRTPSSLARAVAEALRRPSLADDPAGGGVPLHNPSPSIPSLLISSAHASSAAAVALTKAVHLGETSMTPLQRMQAGGSAEANATAAPQLPTSVAPAEVAVVDGPAAEGTPHALKQPRGEREPSSSEQQQSLSCGCFKHLGSSPTLDDGLPPSGPAASFSAPQPPSEDKSVP